MAWGLDTDSFLNAFTRFTSRRAVPKDMISDNDTNFVRAVNELKELVGQLDKDKFRRTTTQKRVKWTVNPPGAPHFSGAHEVIVKAAKKAIAKDLITKLKACLTLDHSPISQQTFKMMCR